MTNRMVLSNLAAIGALLCAYIGATIWANLSGCDAIATLLKDTTPFLIAIPAAYLAHVFQRRALFVSALRNLWSDAVQAKGQLVRHCASKGATDYYEAWSTLSGVIDEVRAVFQNVKESRKSVGYRPFEPLMDMIVEFEKVSPEYSPTPADYATTQKSLTDYWKAFQDVFLEEFSRPNAQHFIVKKGVRRPARGTKAPFARRGI